LPTELATIAAALGLDGDQARQVIKTQSYSAAVEADWKRAAELGVTAVPTSIYNNQALVGFQPYAHYRRLIATAD
jgi:predicted DsbA family dithiol-disulfide isomerase